MTDPIILNPIPGSRSFGESSPHAPWSQAAQVLAIGVQLDSGRDLLGEIDDQLSLLEIPYVDQSNDLLDDLDRLEEFQRRQRLDGPSALPPRDGE